MTAVWLGLGCLLAVAILATSGVSGVRRPIAAAHAYREVARSRGLRFDTRGLALHGEVGGHAVWVGEVMTGHGVERRKAVIASVRFRQPLGLGLHVRRRGLAARVRQGRRQVLLRHRDLDRALAVEADDVARAAQLIDGPVPDALRALTARWPDVRIDDESAIATLRMAEASAPVVDRLVGALLALADTLEQTRATLPPVVDPGPWVAAAQALGLTAEPWLPGLRGTVNEVPIRAAVCRGDAGIGMLVQAQRAPTRPIGLVVRPQGVEGDGIPGAGQDIVVGDPSFDPHFIVQAWDPDAAREVLDDRARRALLALRHAADVRLDDRAVVARHPAPTDPAAALAAVLALVAAVDANAPRTDPGLPLPEPPDRGPAWWSPG